MVEKDNMDLTSAIFLGSGKDGTTWLTADHKFVVKILSKFAKNFLPNLEYFISQDISHKCLVKIILDENKKTLIYGYVPLHFVTEDVALDRFKQICDLQKTLLKHDLLFWDFGFIGNANYMHSRKTGIVQWIDYGGNNILSTKRDIADRFVTNQPHSNHSYYNRKYLNFANNTILQMFTALHLTMQSLPPLKEKVKIQKKIKSLIKRVQNNIDIIDEIWQIINDVGSVDESILKTISELDLLIEDGWDKLERIL